MLKLYTDETAKGKRLDQWLASELLGQFSRSQLQMFIKTGNIFVDGNCVNSAKWKLQGHESIEINVPTPVDAAPIAQNIAISILYEDTDIIVIDKPAGLVVHPGAGNHDNTLVNALLYHCKDSLSGIGGVKRPGIVHRLDKNTSGVMVVAKNDKAHQHLSSQFMDHGKQGHLQRKYVALAWGAPDKLAGTIATYLARSNKDRTKRAVVSSGASGAKYAVTHYKTLMSLYDRERNQAQLSLIECVLETGRTHQIRVHMAQMGHALLYDSEYGAGFKSKLSKLALACPSTLNRQALHAQYLQIVHPANESLMQFISPLPDDMAQFCTMIQTDTAMQIINYN